MLHNYMYYITKTNVTRKPYTFKTSCRTVVKPAKLRLHTEPGGTKNHITFVHFLLSSGFLYLGTRTTLDFTFDINRLLVLQKWEIAPSFCPTCTNFRVHGYKLHHHIYVHVVLTTSTVRVL